MRDCWKTAWLDGLLLWPYKKAILLALLLPIAFAAINRSLLTGISFAMCFAAMTTGYPFFLAEKNRMERLYAMLPVRKSAVVAGRYIGVLLLGAAALGISLAAQPLVLRALGEKVSAADVAGAAVAGALLFALYTVFQLPGYYRFGFLRGRIFMYIPVAGFLATLLLLSRAPTVSLFFAQTVGGSPALSAALALALVAGMYAASLACSIQVVKNKAL